jgi:hypothetical protein
MAVIGRRALAALFVLAVWTAHADQPSDIRSRLEVIATGLTEGNPAAAISPFDQSYADYGKLRNYFGGLTNAFQIVNEIDVKDEEDNPAETKATVHWIITLSDLGSNYTARREGDINVRLVLTGHKWKIVEFSPIDIFDPEQKPWPKPPSH